jgi:steroid 5-alpha reductase family enzyme
MFELAYYLMAALGINLVMFIPGYLFKTDKLTDLSYALTFIILTLFSLMLNEISTFKLILSAMILIWALRLGIFLFIRIRRIKYDKRFDGIRESFSKFLRFWVLQGLAVWIILIPTFFFMNSTSKYVSWIGFIIWILGLAIESIADIQKYIFSQHRKNKDKFINIGLWKYSRHPNYFGEILCWAGIYLFTFFSLSTFQQIIALASPLFIIILLLFVTGLPPLEKSADSKWGKQQDYREYKRKTSILILWIPKR